MARRTAPARAEASLPFETEHSLIINGFWNRLAYVEELIIEAKEILEELKEARAFDIST